jgi:hypothetical protein
MAAPRKTKQSGSSGRRFLAKCPTGIHGLDEITQGGLPRGRPTLVCGGPGCGKTLLGMEFLIRGAMEFGEAGVCLTFEETAEELSRNVASLGFDVDALIAQKKLALDPYRPGDIYDCMARHLPIRYRRAEPASAPAAGRANEIKPAELAALPGDLLTELRNAVTSLDVKRISEAIDRVAPENAALAAALKKCAGSLSFTVILNAIDSCAVHSLDA